MGNSQSISKINFEDMQHVCKSQGTYMIINTLNTMEQDCLIVGTVIAQNEEGIINKYLSSNKSIQIIIYGKNCNDSKIYDKYNQLAGLGFINIFLYTGGMFEWLMLQDIYGIEEFPTTKRQLDFIKYKPNQQLNIGLLEYSR